MARGTVYIYAPGLLGPIPGQARSLVESRPAHQALLEVLARGHAERSAAPADADAESGLCSLWGLSDGWDGLPVGPVLAAGQGYEPAPDETVFRVAPVQLVPDRDHLLMFGPEGLEITEDEASACIQALNQAFADDGLVFHVQSADTWFLTAPGRPRVQTTGLGALAGRPMAEGLPTGEDSRKWIARLNEMQMLLFSLPVNQQRQASGRPMINGVWIWGGGELPERVSSGWTQALGDDPLLLGLARLSGVPVRPVEARAVGWASAHTFLHLSGIPAAVDGERFLRWQDAVEDCCRDWLEPLLRRVRDGTLSQLTLDAGGGTAWTYRRRDRWRIWRRPSNIAGHLRLEVQG